MPAKPVKELTLKERQLYFIRAYVRKGATPEHIPACEKQAQLKPGDGKKLLEKPWAKLELQERLEPIKMEQQRQAILSEVVPIAKLTMEKQLAATYEEIKMHTLDFDVLRGRLMQGVLGIDMNRFPDVLLDYIKTGMVVHGTIQSGNTKKISPPEEHEDNPAALVYTPLFAPKPPESGEAANASQAAQEKPQEGVYDLYPTDPSRPPAKAEFLPPLPPPGASIEEPEKPKTSNPNVIVVDVG